MSTETETASPGLKEFGSKMNNFAWRLFASVTRHDMERPPDTGAAAASILVQLAGLALGGGVGGEQEVEQMIGKSRIGPMAKELYALGQQRSCFKWFPAMLLVAPTGRPFRAEFVDQSQKLGIDVRSSDMKENGRLAVALINKLVGEKCEGHVTEMISPDHRLPGKGVVTATAIYFHPWWAVKFDRTKTTDSPFYETPATERRVKMMYRCAVLPFVEGKVADDVTVQVVGLACRRQSGMVFFMVPSKRFGLREVIEKTSTEKLAALITKCMPRSVRLWLPKVRMSETVGIKDDLTALGMKAWTTTPALPRIMDDESEPMRVDDMIHQIVVRFNEDGDQSETEGEEGTDEQDEKNEESAIKVRLDQPFAYVFRHDPTNAFWLIGASSRPIYR